MDFIYLMNFTIFFNKHKKILRLIYWLLFVLFMLGFAIPSFFFFYLFDGVTTKQMIIQQFNTSNYKVEVLGRVIPKFWHGFSLELGEILVSTNNTKLFDMSNISCQLSWYDLLRGKYKIKRLEINGADIYRDNLLNNN